MPVFQPRSEPGQYLTPNATLGDVVAQAAPYIAATLQNRGMERERRTQQGLDFVTQLIALDPDLGSTIVRSLGVEGLTARHVDPNTAQALYDKVTQFDQTDAVSGQNIPGEGTTRPLTRVEQQGLRQGEANIQETQAGTTTERVRPDVLRAGIAHTEALTNTEQQRPDQVKAQTGLTQAQTGLVGAQTGAVKLDTDVKSASFTQVLQNTLVNEDGTPIKPGTVNRVRNAIRNNRPLPTGVRFGSQLESQFNDFSRAFGPNSPTPLFQDDSAMRDVFYEISFGGQLDLNRVNINHVTQMIEQSKAYAKYLDRLPATAGEGGNSPLTGADMKRVNDLIMSHTELSTKASGSFFTEFRGDPKLYYDGVDENGNVTTGFTIFGGGDSFPLPLDHLEELTHGPATPEAVRASINRVFQTLGLDPTTVAFDRLKLPTAVGADEDRVLNEADLVAKLVTTRKHWNASDAPIITAWEMGGYREAIAAAPATVRRLIQEGKIQVTQQQFDALNAQFAGTLTDEDTRTSDPNRSLASARQDALAAERAEMEEMQKELERLQALVGASTAPSGGVR